MKAQINEVKRMQFLAGIITEGELGVNILPNELGIKGKAKVEPAPTQEPAEEGKYKTQLIVNDKPVMEISTNHLPPPEELRDAFMELERKYRERFDFNDAELAVFDETGEKVGTLSKRDTFLRKRTVKVGTSYPETHGTV